MLDDTEFSKTYYNILYAELAKPNVCHRQSPTLKNQAKKRITTRLSVY